MLQKYSQLTKICLMFFEDALLFEVTNDILKVGSCLYFRKALNNMLDIGKDMDKLTGREKVF